MVVAVIKPAFAVATVKVIQGSQNPLGPPQACRSAKAPLSCQPDSAAGNEGTRYSPQVSSHTGLATGLSPQRGSVRARLCLSRAALPSEDKAAFVARWQTSRDGSHVLRGKVSFSHSSCTLGHVWLAIGRIGHRMAASVRISGNESQKEEENQKKTSHSETVRRLNFA